MATWTRRSARWLAPAALVGVVGLVACSDDSDETEVRPGGPDVSTEETAGDGLPNAWEAGDRAALEALVTASTGDECVAGTGAVPLP